MSYYIVKVKGNSEEFIVNGNSAEHSIELFNKAYVNVEFVK